MAKSSRRSGRGKTPSSSGASTPSSASSGPIPPFTKVPQALQPFVEQLSPDEVYLVHIDTTAEELKRQTFTVPLIVNLIVTAILGLRVYMGISTYPALVGTLIGLKNSMTVDTSTPWPEAVRIILWRTGNICVDYFLVSLLWSWPVNFVRGPLHWRRAIGFLEREIIVRRSNRSWSKELERNRWIRDDEARRDKIVAAVTPERIAKTGYLLVDEDWNLDYAAMVRAHGLVERTRRTDGVKMDEFRTAVLVNTDADGWLIWRVGDDNTPTSQKDSVQRDQLLAFKDKLADMGKEDLFLRWVELIQWESSRPGGFTVERQRSAMMQAKQMFEDENVDFSQFWHDMGGMEGVEGLDPGSS
ncbi:hypothetical protein DTO013E5_2531 [Penicillium roqueforti]|uniref:Genomic scaffold, ProqFM164S02 n=1 Tax=Penicillium roqueforti (strain FM164) TaxID=1365484 RepID=W6Q1U5_PENRF|nr:uncharacterized protein LCP9604111_7794 [Penicillium roqueforti]CDM30518.1 unnamed protein product [Penicillium roqueforti FM164]KAF9242998.1 hypothetical protein LCP9604111_7794 [Penicillium roqueforti]KAI1838301.1 hypothetical protein CBS147337_26 [Penicillium roqueforti]KAI2680763.1 hypothetical protein CBS147355_3743 [Penicillium roqueforti]KAI2690847.1 hypothetical protein LCP963914a_1048 [Penicillium roqueforti]